MEASAGDSVTITSFSMFGSTQVIAPAGADVDVGGLALFGSAECEGCATTVDPDAAEVRVRQVTLFGSLEVVHDGRR